MEIEKKNLELRRSSNSNTFEIIEKQINFKKQSIKDKNKRIQDYLKQSNKYYKSGLINNFIEKINNVIFFNVLDS